MCIRDRFSEYSKEMHIEMFYERRSGEEDDIKEKQGSYQVVTLHGMVRAFESVYCQNPNVVFGTNPANILKSKKEKIFCKDHKPEVYYLASYLFVKFVNMQQKGKFSKHDYTLRFYIIMIVRVLMVGSLNVPELNSSAMGKENKKMLKLLKGDTDFYFIEAKEILVDLLSQQEYAEKKPYDVLRSAEFCRKTKARLKEIIENR